MGGCQSLRRAGCTRTLRRLLEPRQFPKRKIYNVCGAGHSDRQGNQSAHGVSPTLTTREPSDAAGPPQQLSDRDGLFAHRSVLEPYCQELASHNLPTPSPSATLQYAANLKHTFPIPGSLELHCSGLPRNKRAICHRCGDLPEVIWSCDEKAPKTTECRELAFHQPTLPLPRPRCNMPPTANMYVSDACLPFTLHTGLHCNQRPMCHQFADLSHMTWSCEEKAP